MTDALTPAKKLGAQEYLGAAFEPSDLHAVLVRNPRRGETVQRIATVAQIAEPSFQEWLHFKNNREGFDVYIGMNPLKPAARTRTKEDILSIRHLYLDLDHEAAKSLVTIEKSPHVPRPNYVLSTSGSKFQVIWRVDGIAQEQAEALLRAMARRFQGDPAATDSTRVLRIPGFANKKYDNEYIVKAEQRSDRVHNWRDFKLRTDNIDSPYQSYRRSSPRRGSTDGGLSQSEYDWAFALRSLAKGTDPEEIIRRIADYRKGEKHDALDYARRTVAKAQAEFQGRNTADGPVRDDQTPAKGVEFEQ
jgi:RepB DNA-primase N-terminal domain/RepB DNA-primase C-terminal helical domain